MEARPKIKIRLTRTDKLLEALCLVVLVVLWTGTIAGFDQLPDRIPIHFNAAGQADDYGNKSGIFILPALASLLYGFMTILNMFPHLYNYPVKLHAGNAERLYRSATRMIRVLKLAVLLVLSSIVFLTYRAVFSETGSIGKWFLPLAVAMLFIPVIYFLIHNTRAGKSKTRG